MPTGRLRRIFDVSRQLTVEYPFARTYEVEQVGRIQRLGGKRAFAYPDAIPLDPQQELAEGPILEIAPHGGDPWIGIFRRGGTKRRLRYGDD